MPLEDIKEFNNFDKPSEQFLRFAKNYLSNGKVDKNNNPSFRSFLLRILGSINSRYNKKVQIVQKWDGVIPLISRDFIEDFRIYLIQKKIDENEQRQKMMQLQLKEKQQNRNNNKNYYEWIDKKILTNSFEDYRKIIVNLILAPYLIVIKKLSFEDSFEIIDEWLKKCALKRALDFNSKSFTNSALTIAIQKTNTIYENNYIKNELQEFVLFT